jgi:hypothetical protein
MACGPQRNCFSPDGGYHASGFDAGAGRAPGGVIITTREAINKVLDELPDGRLWKDLDFVRYLRWLEKEAKVEADAWGRLSPRAAPELYWPNEPEYTEGDIKRPAKP